METVDFYEVMNDSTIWLVASGYGLRKSDPFSPYLFIICYEGLSMLIKHAEVKGNIHELKSYKNASVISRLLFASDWFLFFRATKNEANVLKTILNIYEEAYW